MIASDSDAVLAKRAAQGDQRAFKVLVDRYGAAVTQAARSKLTLLISRGSSA